MANKYTQIVENLRAASIIRGEGGSPMTEEQLLNEESKLGHPLPGDYREFLRDYAGVEILGTDEGGVGFPLQGAYGGARIYQFFGPKADEGLADIYTQTRANYSLEDGYRWFPGLQLVRDISVPVEIMYWPEELLPIGCDMQANSICLALFGLRPGAVFYWNHTIYEDQDGVYLVADSFDEFMHLLHL